MFKLLQEHTSKDQTRPQLCGVYFDKTHAVATDGHRLVSIENSNKELSELSKAHLGQIYSFKDHMVIDSKYPNWRSLVPDITKTDKDGNTLYKKSVALVPSWFKILKCKSESVFIGINGIYLFKPEGVDVVAVNPSFLSAYRDHEHTIYIKDKHSPIVIKGIDWTAVVMPMRV